MKNTALMLTSIVLFVLLGAFAAPVQGQGLGDAARREAERRARLKEPTKVITNADVDAVPSRGGPVPPAPARPDAPLVPAVAAAADADTPVAPADHAAPPTIKNPRDEQHWRERAQVIRERLNRLQSDAVALEGRVEGLQAEIDAASASQRAALADELQQTSTMLTQVQGELRLIQNEWRQFEDRAVQARIPTAWIR